MGELLNLIGLSTGVVLYAMLLAMVVRTGRASEAPARLDLLLLTTSVLGLIWNLCALPAYALPKVGIQGPFPSLAAVGFSALGFLPAVVVHSVLRGEHKTVDGAAKRSVVAIAYGVSTIAGLLQARATLTGLSDPSVIGMRLLTYTFIGLIIPLAALTRRQPGSRRAMWAAALAAFAVSALHLSQLDQVQGGEASWPIELLGHHASIPLAIAMLYQDYPFALADLFLKRALTLLMLVSVAFVVLVVFGGQSAAFAQFLRVDQRHVGALVMLWVGTALLYPAVQRSISWFVDSVILSRPDYRSLRGTAGGVVEAHEDIGSMLLEVCELLRPAMSARTVTWDKAAESPDANAANASETNQPAAVVIIPTAEAPRYRLIVGELTGGRRVLSDDLSMLESIANIVARRIDAVRITQERYESELREQESAKLATEAELRALRAQVNPHFLFNALTTLGYLIQTTPDRAIDTLMRLTSLLRGVLRSEGEFATLGREIDIVESYLEIEQARFEERLRVRIDVPQAIRVIRIPVLLLQPIVENAVKHGIAPLRHGGEVIVQGHLEPQPDGRVELALTVQDTGAGATDGELDRGRMSGVGLRNVERRLICQYGSAASLSVRSTPGRGTTVDIRLPAESSVALDGAGTARRVS